MKLLQFRKDEFVHFREPSQFMTKDTEHLGHHGSSVGRVWTPCTESAWDSSPTCGSSLSSCIISQAVLPKTKKRYKGHWGISFVSLRNNVLADILHVCFFVCFLFFFSQWQIKIYLPCKLAKMFSVLVFTINSFMFVEIVLFHSVHTYSLSVCSKVSVKRRSDVQMAAPF